MPPSAITGTPESPTASRHSTSACSCGTPKLVVIRVVQPPPGPMPTLMPSAPRSSRNRAPSAVATLPAIISTSLEALAELAHRLLHDDGVAVRDVDDEDVDAGAHELGRALQVVAGRADGRADAQPALLVARGKRQPPLVHEVARRDQAEQAAVVADERELLHLALDHDALGLGRLERATMNHEPVERRHPLRDAGVAIVHEPHVAFGEQPLQPLPGIDDDERADARARHQGPAPLRPRPTRRCCRDR